MIETVIGILFIILLISLLASTLAEFYAQFLGLRGNNLEKAIFYMLDDIDKKPKERHKNDSNSLYKKFKASDWYKTLEERRGNRNKKPSYINPSLFSDILTKAIYDVKNKRFFNIEDFKTLSAKADFSAIKGLEEDKVAQLAAFKEFFKELPTIDKDLISEEIWEELLEFLIKSNYINNLFIKHTEEWYTDQMYNPKRLKSAILDIKNIQIRNRLLFLYDEAGGELNQFKSKINNWYLKTIERAKGWYKKKTQLIIFMIGFVLAAIFNANIFSIYHHLSTNSSARTELTNLAQAFTENDPYSIGDSIIEKDSLKNDLKRVFKLRNQIDSLIQHDLKATSSLAGLGWGNVKLNNPGKLKRKKNKDSFSILSWGYTILGWLFVAAAVSLGAPFWFDLLKMFVNIRSAGQVPESSLKVPSKSTNKPY